MKSLYLILIPLLTSIAVSCAEAPHEIRVQNENLFPEGITTDGNDFYITSLYNGTITKTGTDGSQTTFAEADELISTIGVKADLKRQRLLVCNSDPGAGTKTSAETQKKTAGLGVFSLETGEKIDYIDLAALHPQDSQFCNDMTVAKDGTIYITNSFSPVIYKVDPDYEPEILLRSGRFTGEGFNLNGIVLLGDDQLLVAKYNEGVLFRIPLDDPESFTEVELSQKMPGADGLLWGTDGSLIVIANADTNQVFKVRSEDEWKTATVESVKDTGDVFATTGTIYENQEYYLEAKLNKLFSGKLPVKEFRIVRL